VSRESVSATPWYVVFSKPRQEQQALQQLLNQEYAVYLPMLTEWKRKAGEWRSQVVPMFPRYMFVRPSRPQQGLGPVRSTLGVSNLVRFGLEMARVRPALISALHELEVASARLRAQPPGADLAVGLPVEILEGPFAGLRGVVQASARDRVVVLLDVLGREARVRLDRGALAAA